MKGRGQTSVGQNDEIDDDLYEYIIGESTQALRGIECLLAIVCLILFFCKILS